jgi:hypothetical protein
MDYLYMLNRKLDFIEFLYRTADEPFRSAMDAIQDGRDPYDANGSESDGEPPFTSEWIEFNDGCLALGNLTLSMITVVLQEFLAASVENMRLGTPPKLPGRSWFDRYRALIKEALDIDIRSLARDPAVIEELILARNLTQHPGDIGTNWVYQDPEYAKRYPQGEFVNRFYAAILQDGWDGPDPVPAPLEVSQEKVSMAIKVVRDFCASMEVAFQQHPQYWS